LGFIRKVYGILATMLIITGLVAWPLQLCSREWIAEHTWILFFVAFVLLVTVCTLACQQDLVMKFPNNYILLLVYTWCIGTLVGFYTALYTWESVLLCVGATFCIILTLTIYSMFASTDFFGLAPYFLVGLSLLFIFGNVLVILSVFDVEVFWLEMVYAFLGAFLFSCFIVFDTQLILGESGGHSIQFSVDDYAFAALTLYADIMMLFLFILRILGERDNRKTRG